MRVFVDTNVLVSALATRGLSADVLRLILAEHELVTGEVILTELARVLERQFGAPPDLIRSALGMLKEHTVVPRPAEPAPVPTTDPDDRWVLASAMAGEADVLVTGDRDLLDLGDEAPLPILAPRGFWELVRRPG